MKTRKYFSKGIGLDIWTVNSFDLMNLSTSAFKSRIAFKNWNEFFKEEIARSGEWKTYATKRFKKVIWGNYLWRMIIRMFLDLLMHDLLYENDRFVFPHWNRKLHLKVSVRDNKKCWWYKYNPLTEGDDYEPVLIFSSLKQRAKMRTSLYWVYMTRRWRKKMNDQSLKFSYN